MRKLLVSGVISVAALASLITTGTALAHVTVKPAAVPAGSFQVFNTSVPAEGSKPTTKVRVVLPEGLDYVSPTTKPGWKIDQKFSGSGSNQRVSEIIWSGGEIEPGFRDDFSFSAKAPEKEGDINWKAYQTLAGGEVIAWDQTPSDQGEEGGKPYSTTAVTKAVAGEHGSMSGHDDHMGTVKDDSSAEQSASTSSDTALYLAIAAFVVSIVTAGLVAYPLLTKTTTNKK